MERVPVGLGHGFFVSWGVIYPGARIDFSFTPWEESGPGFSGAEDTRQVPGQEAGSFHWVFPGEWLGRTALN